MGATLLVALGSALGGAARYWVALLAARWWGEAFPWGTILINVAGSFVIGFFGTLTVPDGPFPAPLNWRVFVMVGLCGGFTTFSSFSLQTLNLARDGGGWSAGANVVASVALCLLAVAAGHEAAERIGVRRASAAAPPLGVVALLDHPATADAVLRAADWSAGVLGQPIEALFLHESLAGFLPTEQVASGTAGRAAIESALRARFAAWRSRGGAGRWRALGGDSAGAIAGQAARAALVVIGHPADGAGDPGRRAADLALFDLGRLTLLVPPQSPSPARHVALAWKPDGSSASAGRAALPFLLRADRVSLLLAREADARETLPDAAFARLREAGVSVSVRRFAAERPIGEALLAEARDAGADLLVMGAVRRGAVAEWIVGGATASILAAADLPVLLRAEPA